MKALEGPLWRALLVFRIAALGYAAVLMIGNFQHYHWPLGGWLILSVMAAWTVVSSLAYARPERRAWPLLTADLAVTAACLLATRWIVQPDGLGIGAPTLPMAWVASPVVAWAISGGRRRGAIAALLMSAADVVVRDGVSQATVNGPVLMVLAGIGIGHIARLAIDAEARLERATELEAATRERERIARGIHDSVLQVLALLQRRGAELGGEAAELGRLAGEQEATLRILVTSSGPPRRPSTPPSSPSRRRSFRLPSTLTASRTTTATTTTAATATTTTATAAVASPVATGASGTARTADPPATAGLADLADSPGTPDTTGAPGGPGPAGIPDSPVTTGTGVLGTTDSSDAAGTTFSGAAGGTDTAGGTSTRRRFSSWLAAMSSAAGSRAAISRGGGSRGLTFGAGEQPDLVDLRILLQRHSTTGVSVAAPATEVLLPAPVAAEVAAAVAAAVDNVRLHAGPGARTWLLVEELDDTVAITIRDNGPGIPDGRLTEAEQAGRLGVAQSIRGRIRDLGGTTTLISSPTTGTEIELQVPR